MFHNLVLSLNHMRTTLFVCAFDPLLHATKNKSTNKIRFLIFLGLNLFYLRNGTEGKRETANKSGDRKRERNKLLETSQ